MSTVQILAAGSAPCPMRGWAASTSCAAGAKPCFGTGSSGSGKQLRSLPGEFFPSKEFLT